MEKIIIICVSIGVISVIIKKLNDILVRLKKIEAKLDKK